MALGHRENFHSIYILLFLNVAFFFMQLQDASRFVQAFALERSRVMAGELWRLFTYQFLTSSFLGSAAVGIFVTLLILYIMGSAIEEEYGSVQFLTLFLISTFTTAGIAFVLGSPLIGSFFLAYSLLFVYADLYPEQTFYILFVLPMKVKWIAWIALAFLVLGVIGRSPSSFAAAGGALATFGYYRLALGRGFRFAPRTSRPPLPARAAGSSSSAEALAQANLARFAEISGVLESGSLEERQALIERLSEGVVPGVNICPPADYKPKNEDLYCVRCEGFNECSIRYIRLAIDDEAVGTEKG